MLVKFSGQTCMLAKQACVLVNWDPASPPASLLAMKRCGSCCACACACVCVCARACVVCVCVCARACTQVEFLGQLCALPLPLPLPLAVPLQSLSSPSPVALCADLPLIRSGAADRAAGFRALLE